MSNDAKVSELLGKTLTGIPVHVERDLRAERERAERAINCISAIKKHQQMIAGSMAVNSAIMRIINDWEIKELENQKEIE